MYFALIEFIILIYTFLVIYFDLYKEYMICLISFSKFSDVSSAFTWQERLLVFEVFV